MTQSKKAHALGFNHIALDVGDVDEALAFYARIVDFKLRGKSTDMAFIDLGDQFLALAVRQALAEAGVEILPGSFLDFYDPWGNRVEIVGYENVQFSKAPGVLRGMGLAHLSKSAKAIQELTEKGMAPD
jgi:lactoylglutathione lyase